MCYNKPVETLRRNNMEKENTSFEKELFNDHERKKLISLNLIK